MAIAFILINTDVSKEDEVVEKLKTLSEVKEVDMVYGIYDIIAKVEAPDLKAIREGVSDRIRNIEGIRKTMTMIAADE
ncbi:MAG: Lrp/AsnC family transcriptional regulator [Methanobacteriota archaeon]|nr:MAG: Lrp/AsnC family transcriptional regulator [Euryarchaeota archaeon]